MQGTAPLAQGCSGGNTLVELLVVTADTSYTTNRPRLEMAEVMCRRQSR
jgi:hypothetical protein